MVEVEKRRPCSSPAQFFAQEENFVNSLLDVLIHVTCARTSTCIFIFFMQMGITLHTLFCNLLFFSEQYISGILLNLSHFFIVKFT